MKRIVPITAVLLLIFSLLAGCSAQPDETVQANASPASGVAAETAAADGMFTDRDKEIGYSEAESTVITLADGATTVNGNGAKVGDNIVTLSGEGTYILRGSLSNGQIIVDADDSAKLQLVLDGVDITHASSAAIYVKNADKVFITTADGSENTLSVTGAFVAIDDNNIDGAIFSKADLTLNGVGLLTIDCGYGHGVVSKDDLAITSGSYAVTAAKHALSGKNSVRIADGSFTLDCGTDAIHSQNDDDTSLGFVYIAGGSFQISAGDDGIHAGTTATVLGGTIDIKKSVEGIEGMSIEISGGEITLIASDDGLNAAGGNDQSAGADRAAMAAVEGCTISISGGTLSIDAAGDGIDSNGSLSISGGTTLVSGPTNRGNGALDYNGTAAMTGGTLLAAGSSGMVQGFGDSSTQGSILYVLTDVQQAGTAVVLKDDGGNVIAQFSPAKQFQALNISVPELAQGKTYTLVVGTQEYAVTLDTLSYSNGGGMGGFGGMGRPGGMNGDFPQGGTDGSFPQGGPGGMGGQQEFPGNMGPQEQTDADAA